MQPLSLTATIFLAFPVLAMMAVVGLSFHGERLARLDRAILGSIVAKTTGSGRVKLARKLETAARDITALGGDAFMLLVLVLGSGLLLASKGLESARDFCILLITSRVLGWILKAVYKRERPPRRDSSPETFTSSFPSIHTMSSFAIGFAVCSTILGPQFTGPELVLACFVSGLVGATRLYFAVHWPSDIAAGFLAGLAVCTSYVALTAN